MIHLQLFIVGVVDGMSIGTISKKSLPSVFDILPAFVTVARTSFETVRLPNEPTLKCQEMRDAIYSATEYELSVSGPEFR